jgi:glycosyltransferase involved in cell wall biosynthesis
MIQADLLCFSHLRWNFVFQRPNHLMKRCSEERRVFFIEEPLRVSEASSLQVEELSKNLFRVVPQLTVAKDADETDELAQLLQELAREYGIREPIHWYYSPMFLDVTRGLESCLTVYDCMDELSNFKNSPPQLKARERELMARADLVFTGGMALYEAKKHLHAHVHGVPSSVDVQFFALARTITSEPEDQRGIGRPRIGYYGVIDERIDLTLLAELADQRPDVQFVMVGPVVKIAHDSLPVRPNIHYLGAKSYDELPSYLAGWDIAFMPFALNDATRFISPTKTPEYLAAGKPVLSSAIRDVVEPYERLGLVRVGRSTGEFVEHIDQLLVGQSPSIDERRDAFLAHVSWDRTWAFMRAHMEEAFLRSCNPVPASTAAAAEPWSQTCTTT